jgi:hypothetical protein
MSTRRVRWESGCRAGKHRPALRPSCRTRPKPSRGWRGWPQRAGQPCNRNRARPGARVAASVWARGRPLRSPPRTPAGPLGPKRARLGWRSGRKPSGAPWGTTCEKPCEVPSCTAPLPLRHTPRGRRRPLRERPHAWRVRGSARLLWRWRRGRVGRRARGVAVPPSRPGAGKTPAAGCLCLPHKARAALGWRRARGAGARRPVGRC